MKLRKYARSAFVGWLAGIGSTLLIGLIWPAIFPGIVRPEHYFDGPSLNLPSIILLSMAITSLPALLGGLIGGIIPREGGRNDQIIAAAIGGIFLSLPFSCYNYWLLSAG